jgi:hypothetical protein
MVVGNLECGEARHPTAEAAFGSISRRRVARFPYASMNTVTERRLNAAFRLLSS